MLPFRSARTASRRPAGNMGVALQRKASWLVMGALVFVVLIGQSAWRKQQANNAAPNDGHLVDNRVEPGGPGPDRPLAAADERPIMPGELKLPEAKPLLPGQTKHIFGDLSTKLFDEVQDDTTYAPEEIRPTFTLFHTLLKYDPRDIELASSGRKTFVQLFEQAKVYRGDLVTVGGKAVRVIPQLNKPPFPPGVDPALIIPKQYEVWIQPDGSQLPIVINCLEMPADFQPGVEIDATGYFFKRLGYASAQEADASSVAKGMTNVYRSAPLILARTVRVRPKAAAAAVVAAADEGPAFLQGVPLPIPAKYVLPVLGIGMVVLTFMSAWAYKISRSSVLADGPIIGRRRKEEPTEVTNLNSLNLEP